MAVGRADVEHHLRSVQLSSMFKDRSGPVKVLNAGPLGSSWVCHRSTNQLAVGVDGEPGAEVFTRLELCCEQLQRGGRSQRYTCTRNAVA